MQSKISTLCVYVECAIAFSSTNVNNSTKFELKIILLFRHLNCLRHDFYSYFFFFVCRQLRLNLIVFFGYNILFLLFFQHIYFFEVFLLRFVSFCVAVKSKEAKEEFQFNLMQKLIAQIAFV